jgi:hypothetical protein
VIPGSNLLNRAARLIRLMPIDYYAAAARSANAVGQYVPTFQAPVVIQASVQAVPRDTYVKMGLDLQRNYWMIYTSINAVDLERDSSGDRFVFNNRMCQIESNNSWFLSDGWVGCLAVEVAVNETPLLATP